MVCTFPALKQFHSSWIVRAYESMMIQNRIQIYKIEGIFLNLKVWMHEGYNVGAEEVGTVDLNP